MSLPSLPPEQLPQIVVIQQPQAYQPPAFRGPPRSFYSGWGVLGWVLAVAVGVSLVGSLAMYGAIAYGVWGVSSAVGEAVEEFSELRASRLKSARSFARSRLADYGITAISDEAELSLDGPMVTLAGMGQHRTGAVYPYLIRWRVATFGKQTRWDVQELVLDGEKREH